MKGGNDMNNFAKVGSEYYDFPMFVPPYINEHLARAGVESAKHTLMQSHTIRKKRAGQHLDLGLVFKVTAVAGKANRKIFDSQHKWETQVKLVRSEGDAPVPDGDVNNAYDFMGDFREFLKNKLNRNSLDDKGMDLIGNVHYGEKYNNAFWDGEQMVFGDGDGDIFVSFTKSLDVVAHEMGHGVVHFYADFNYQDQPGALHEHYADVFGSVVTQYVEKQTANTADWLIGDEIMGPELYGEALRSMAAPGTAYDNPLLGKDPQPDHMKDLYTGTDDNGGVHLNSGIMNKAFYLAAREIETDNAFLIWYTALQKLWPTAKFNDACGQIIKASQDLVKAEKIKKGAPQKVRAAFKEVGLPFKG